MDGGKNRVSFSLLNCYFKMPYICQLKRFHCVGKL
nr:MAG TPA: hypothetical protein [Caudoviricetes sp.]